MQLSNKEAVNEVLSAIREVCDLKRLEFGCEVTPKNGNGSVAKVFKVYEDGAFDGLIETETEDAFATITLTKAKLANCEIIGLPVHLEHLLIALGSRYTIIGKGGIWKYINSNWEIVDFTLSIDLQKSVEQNLNDNPELLQWLHEVLVNKK